MADNSGPKVENGLVRWWRRRWTISSQGAWLSWGVVGAAGGNLIAERHAEWLTRYPLRCLLGLTIYLVAPPALFLAIDMLRYVVGYFGDRPEKSDLHKGSASASAKPLAIHGSDESTLSECTSSAASGPEISHVTSNALKRRSSIQELSGDERFSDSQCSPDRGSLITGFLRIVYALLESRCQLPATQAKLRITLFVPEDASSTRLQQIARWRWDGIHATSSTTVQTGACAAGHAWACKEVYELAISPELGFVKSLIRCGVSQRDAEAHQLQDRTYFCSIPVFQDDLDPAPYRREVLPLDKEVVAVLVIDAAATNCLPTDWQNEIAILVLPGLVSAMRHCALFGRAAKLSHNPAANILGTS